MARLAIIHNATQVVSNVIDAPADWAVPSGYTSRMLQPDEPCGPGWTFNGATFTEPPPYVPKDREVLTDTLTALALLTLDEINLLRQRCNALQTAIANNSTVGAIRSAVAALPAMPDRTRRQLLDSVKARLSDGSLD